MTAHEPGRFVVVRCQGVMPSRAALSAAETEGE